MKYINRVRLTLRLEYPFPAYLPSREACNRSTPIVVQRMEEVGDGMKDSWVTVR